MPTARNPVPVSADIEPPAPRRGIPSWLRVLTATVILTGFGLALWFGVPAYRQYAAILAIERVGGAILEIRPRGPDWLRIPVGNEQVNVFDEIVQVSLGHSPVTDSTLAHVGTLTNLKVLELNDTDVTDESLVQLERLHNLKTLDIHNTPVTDEGLLRLKELPSLEFVFVYRTHVTEGGIAELKQVLPDLTIIDK
jgi:hypothetical protein